MNYRFGSYPTMITPYTPAKEVDYATAEKYVEWYAKNGCDGIFAVCQSSEIAYLTLEERVKLNGLVYKAAKSYGLTVVSSGHVAHSIDAQADELCRIADSGTDALILITNRLDPENLGDDEWIKNAEALLKKLPPDINLGLYECPMPYKRLVTDRILKWCLETGRFYFMKDTCCDMNVIEKRMELLHGSHFALLNANCQTLLSSLRCGGKGYCGIMANFHPKLYAWLCKNYESEPQKAELVQSVIGTFGFTEVGLPYPLTAKYHMNLCGIPTEVISRNRLATELTRYGRECMEQMKLATDRLEGMLGI
ncbi:MAG: dihydrodipicolinate synthase family protein [Clostridia bacterium]|nr:dihydrodipicolinate synthase family protein [Clostridia bacterium]